MCVCVCVCVCVCLRDLRYTPSYGLIVQLGFLYKASFGFGETTKVDLLLNNETKQNEIERYE